VNKNKTKILIWSLTWAVLLLAVLYSPLGSPDLYSPNAYYVTNHNFIYKGDESENFPQMERSNSSNSGGYQVTDFPTVSVYSGSNYPVYLSSGSDRSTASSFNYSTTVMSNKTTSSYSNGAGGGMQQIVFSSGSRNNNRSASQSESTLFMSTDMSLLAQNNITNRQSGSGSWPNQTDPGGDPTGLPIPVGDGWIALFLFAIAYSILKVTFYKK